MAGTWQNNCGCRGIYINGIQYRDVACLNHVEESFGVRADAQIRKFDSGATRDTDEGKLKYEGFISPLVEKRFAQYMHIHRKMTNGSLRAPDNWQNGMPLETYADSLVRHVQDFRLHHDKFAAEAVDADLESVLCAIRFNVDGYLFELLKTKAAK